MATTPQLRSGSMTDLQNRWYNGVVGGLGLSPQGFQLNAPATLLPPIDDGLWATQNAIAPAWLTFPRGRCRGDEMLAEYAAVVGQLTLPESTFAQDIGAQTFAKWSLYLAGLDPAPGPAELPAIFQQWAMLWAPDVATIGTEDLTSMALEAAAQDALAPYLGPGAKPVDFARGYADLVAVLAASPGAGIQFDSSAVPGDVTKTWAAGVDAGVGGLWAGACASCRLSRAFAAGAVTVTATFERWTRSVCTPGPWYDSSALGIALRTAGAAPWPADANPTWEQVFGAGGSMRRLTTALVVVDGIQATVTCDAPVREADQAAIVAAAPAGIWPFYLPAGDAGVTSSVSFDARGALRVEVTAEPGHPVVLGQDVVSVEQFLGAA